MAENGESSEDPSVLRKWFPHLRGDRQEELAGVSDQEIKARTPQPEVFDPVGDAIKKAAGVVSSVLRRQP